ncbi:hypothetical protein [Cellvibrio zantedeschiae]|uniref:hypothetical protein n=1 Tax=Cellvibrio zantedeschiae TaxID=1237077 RepID=UPI001671CE2E|nr:hypothetical protein [Cellvibrio zantedeschiae]
MIFLLTIELVLCFFFPVVGWLFFLLVIVKEFDDMNIIMLSLAPMGGLGLYGILKLYLHLMSSKSYEQGISPSKITYACVGIAIIPASLAVLAMLDIGKASPVQYFIMGSPFVCAVHFVLLSLLRSRKPRAVESL